MSSEENKVDWKSKIILPSVFERETVKMMKQMSMDIEILKLGLKSVNQKITRIHQELRELQRENKK